MPWNFALNKDVWREALKIGALYFVLAVGWIALSDEALLALGVESSADELTRYQTLKGFAFVSVTAVLLVVLMVRSVSRLRMANQLLDETESSYLESLEGAEVAVFVQTGDKLLSANENAARILGVESNAELVGRDALEFLDPANREEIARLVNEYRTAGKGSPLLEHKLVRRDGTVINARIAVAMVSVRGRQAIQMLVQDVTALKQEQERAAALLSRDALTGLPNFAIFRDRVGQAAIHAARSGRCVAVGMFNIDRFQRVVDRLGYINADEVLKAFAARLSEAVRTGDTAARIGGDEFAVALTDVADREDVGIVIAKITGELAQSFRYDGHELSLSLTGGVSIYPDDGNTVDELIANANSALYRARENARGSIEYYQEKIGKAMRERARIANALPDAIRRSEFTLHYQPLFSAATFEIVGCEALIRWTSPELGVVGPADFIPVAEDLGLIGQIGDWVLGEACSQIGRWRQAGFDDIIVSVNLSARQLRQPDLPESIARALQHAGIEPRLLELELTESALLEDVEHMISAIRRLKALGISLAIDDFGTGYSSLAHLRRFQADRLKIDQSFVKEIPNDREAVAIIKTIIDLAKALGMKTVAEGVETEAQARSLKDWGCTELQGYFFAYPAPADELEASLLRAASSR